MPEKLPPPCPNCEPQGGQGVMVERELTEGAFAGEKRDFLDFCDCDRGRELRRLKAVRRQLAENPPAPEPPRLSKDEGYFFALELAAIPEKYPYEEAARSLIGSTIRSICPTITEAQWLVERMVRLYKRWPGIEEMRWVYCSSGRWPLDADVSKLIASEDYPDGLPTEAPAPVVADVSHQIIDPESRAIVGRLAAGKTMDRGRR